jgi:hypothetical protein
MYPVCLYCGSSNEATGRRFCSTKCRREYAIVWDNEGEPIAADDACQDVEEDEEQFAPSTWKPLRSMPPPPPMPAKGPLGRASSVGGVAERAPAFIPTSVAPNPHRFVGEKCARCGVSESAARYFGWHRCSTVEPVQQVLSEARPTVQSDVQQSSLPEMSCCGRALLGSPKAEVLGTANDWVFYRFSVPAENLMNAPTFAKLELRGADAEAVVRSAIEVHGVLKSRQSRILNGEAAVPGPIHRLIVRWTAHQLGGIDLP